MTRVYKAYAASIEQVDDNTSVLLCSTGAKDLAGEIIEQSGIDLSLYRNNPIVLFSHNPEYPVGTAADVELTDAGLRVTVKWAPAGVSHKADEVRGLVKAGVLKGVSIGFDDVETVPMDSSRPRGPQRYLKILLMEVSIVSLPCNPEAGVTVRAYKGSTASEWKVGASRDLPIDDSNSWDGSAAEASIFEHAGGDDFDPAIARKGFLVYDASNDKKRGGYKLPIAHVVDGELKVPKGAIRAAASRLPDTDIPDDVKKTAGSVLDHYKEKAGMADGNKSARRGKTKAGVPAKAKDLWDTSSFAYAVMNLGWICEAARCESAIEGDESELPGKLLEIVQLAGAALIAMTQEEVAELIEALSEGITDPGDGLTDAEASIVTTGRGPAHAKALSGIFRAKHAVAHLKEGRKFSAAAVQCMKDAIAQHEEGMDFHRQAMAAHKKGMKAISDMIDDTDTHEIQTSDGTDDSTGSEGGKAVPGVMTKEQRLARAKALAA